MAVLPNADDVGQINTEPQRKMGIGGWSPDVIGKAANEEGGALEKLGSTIGDIGATAFNQAQQKQKEDEQKTNALQHAQATGALYTASTQALLDAQNASDPAKVKEIQSGFSDLVPKIAATISDQNTRDMWTAQNTPHVAEIGSRFAGRATDLTNNSAIANGMTSVSNIVANAAKIDDDAASAKALDGVKGVIGPLVATNAIDPVKSVEWGKGASSDYAAARSDYLKAKALTTNTPADWGRYLHFSGVDPKSYGIGQDGNWLPGWGPGGQMPLAASGGAPTAAAAGGATGASVTPPGGDPALAARIQAIAPTLPNGECVTLVQKAAGLPPVGLWARGANAVQNQLPIGTPVATFMDRAGNPSNRYDGGQGVGAPGNNTTHAGIVAGYTADGDLILWNQWAAHNGNPGSGGPVVTTYKRGAPGGGEKDANNYFAINTGAPAGPGAYPALGGVGLPGGGSASGGVGAPSPQGYGAINAPYRAPLDAKGEGGFTSPATMYQFLRSQGASNNEALMLTGAAANESSFNQTAVHDGGKGYGLFGHNLQRLNLMGMDWQQQSIEALNELRKRPESALVNSAKTPEDLALAEMHFEEPRGYSNSAPQNGDNYAGRLNTLRYFSQMANGTFTGSNGAPIPGRSYAGPGGMTIPGSASLTGMSAGLPIEPLLSSPLSPLAVPPPDAVHPAAPPQAKWPQGATGVTTGPDGSASFTMGDGSSQPVPGSRATGAQWAALPPPPPGSVANMLSPQTRAEMQLRAVGDIQRWQRESAAATRRDDRGDKDTINSAIKDMEQGSRLSGQDADAGFQKMVSAFGNSANPEVRQQLAVAEAVRNRIKGLWNASPEVVSAAVARDRAELDNMVASDPRHPGLDIARSVVESEENYAKNFAQEAKKDPIGRAAREGFIPPPKALDPASPTLAQDISDRVQQAKVAAQAMGLPEAQFIRPDERVTMRRVGQYGGDSMVNMAKAVVSGAGPDAQSVFRQIGGDAPAFMTIGGLALDPNVDQSLTIRRLADTIAAMNDKGPSGAAKGLPIFTEGTLAKNVLANPLSDQSGQGGPYSKFSPDAFGRINAAARLLMTDDARQAGFDPATGKVEQPFVDKAYNAALGGHIDTSTGEEVQYGGVTTAGGGWSGPSSYKVIVPSNMRADKFDTVIGQLNAGDIKAMGADPHVGQTPISADMLKQGRFVAVPGKDGLFHGVYTVELPDPKNGNQFHEVEDGRGRVWHFDMSRVEDRMRGSGGSAPAVPGAFMDRATPRLQPRYRDVKPMIEPGDGAVASGEPSIPTGNE
jgi:hypothetical protein